MDPKPKYAVLGATGNCGTALIELLLKRPDAHVNAYCRSRAKLFRQLPQISNAAEQVSIYEGAIQDKDIVAACIRGCKAIFLVVSTNDNIPGCRMAQEITSVVIEALRKTAAQDKVHFPTLVLLSSSTIDDHLSRHMPHLLRQMLLCSAHYVYQDILEAEKLIRAEESWLKGIYIKPGALSVDVQRGHALSLHEQDGPLSYLDLAAGMIEAADDTSGTFDGNSVSVVNTGGKARFPTGTPLCIVVGLLSYFLPVLHPMLPKGTGPR